YTHREVAAVVATQCVGIDLYVTRGNACRPCGKGQDSAAPHGGAPGRDHATVDGQPDPDRVAPAPFDRNCDRAALTGDRRETAADLDARDPTVRWGLALRTDHDLHIVVQRLDRPAERTCLGIAEDLDLPRAPFRTRCEQGRRVC